MKKNKSLKTIGQWGERSFLSSFVPQLSKIKPSFFIVPPGDDAAVLSSKGQPVLTIDGLTEGTHFLFSWFKKWPKKIPFTFGRALGWKAMGSSLSDLAAMGPTIDRWVMVYLATPHQTPLTFLSEFQKGIQESAKHFHVSVVGGDTVKAKDLSIVVAAGGSLKGRAVTRSKAKVGDLVCVAGSVGDASVGLQLLKDNPLSRLRERVRVRERNYFIQRFFQHTPLFNEGSFLSEEPGVTSLMDLSDSLKDSLEILNTMSHVGFRIQVQNIPVSPMYKKWIEPKHSIKDLLYDRVLAGEDYALLFTAHPSCLPRLEKRMKFSLIGEVRPLQRGNCYLLNGQKITLAPSFSHF
ncbi:MAG: thiamine-phosphate kinase [Elusimicrobiota bacterium]